MPGHPECDPAKLAPINEFDARECPDGIYRNRWGCRFCSVEGCGLVSDMVLGGKEVCVFHAAAQGYEAEMTEVMRLYRPLIILAKGYDKLPNMTYLQRDENGLIRCHTNFRHPFNLSWSGKTCDIRRSSKTTS